MNDDRNSYWLPAAIALAFVAIAIFGVVTFHNTIAVREGEQEIARSYIIRETTRELLSSMKDMETGQRGFLITGNELYLDAYFRGLENVELNFTQLKDLIHENKVQRQHLEQVKHLNEDRKAYLAETIQLRRDSPGPTIPTAVLELLSSGRGKEKLDEIRVIVEQILSEQQRQLVQQEAVSEERAVASEFLIVAGNSLALGLLVGAGAIAHLDRKRRDDAESQMLAKQAELVSIINSSHDGIITFGHDMQIRLMNPTAASIYRVDPERLVGMNVLALCPSARRSEAEAKIRHFLSSDDSMAFIAEAIGLRSDGHEFPYKGTMTKTIAGDEFVTWMVHDLSESKANEAKIREQASILDQVRDAILVCDMEGRILFWNRGSEQLFGYSSEEASDRNVVDLLFKEIADFWTRGQETLADTGVYQTEINHQNQDGSLIAIAHRRTLIRNEQGIPYAQLCLNFDVTERKREESRSRRSQRLISIGTLAGGIAHDLNNLLTPILMGAKLLMREGSDHQRLAKTILTSAERGGQMIKKLLAFAGGEDGPRAKIDIADVLNEAHGILQHTLPKSIDLTVAGDEHLLSVNGNATEISQIIMNLVINARDALPDGGRIEITAENAFVDSVRAKQSDDLKKGPYVLIRVRDNGEGIEKHHIDHIFDPFFTTKEQGKGTGLGLSTSLGIVRSHGGDIYVNSDPGKGTTFSIYLPCDDADVEAGPEMILVKTPTGNGESILIVDDESLILETAAETLRTNGYEVTTATSGRKAIETLSERQDGFDLVIVDMMMPGMDGMATKNKLRQIQPEIQVVASSGLRRPSSDGVHLSDFDAFLSKPYSDENLLQTVHRVLQK
ncbi:CHASE3 domain-containing protein [Stieleria sp. JC731]|uniref:CHASE3 domain-containing protein n=1 Tax=Pirellulaceae TaxID=2691357 RepID=UPI001E4EDDD4|nr:CHASE3 domain-containing protein [Stieleria sp. JC731]MCC9602402.1 CHASE3 domain-containing protein [Stieleria sp. JC731]